VNGVPVAAGTELLDRDQVLLHLPTTLEEVLSAIGNVLMLVHYTFTVNGQPRRYSIAPQLAINNLPAMPSTVLRDNDAITIMPPPQPSIGTLLGIAEDIGFSETITILLNGTNFFVPTRRHTVLLNKQPAKLIDPASNNATIEYFCQEQSNPTISDVLLAAEFNPRVLPIGAQVAIVLNQQPTEYTAHVQTGDSIDIVITTPCSE
jgi:hypothetical protein